MFIIITKSHLAVVDVNLAVRAGEPLLAHALVARHAVHARGAGRAGVRRALVYVYRAVFACDVQCTIE